MTKEECKDLLDYNLRRIYYDEHELTDEEINTLAELFSSCKLGRELTAAIYGIDLPCVAISYDDNYVVIRCSTNKIAQKKFDKIKAAGYEVELSPGLSQGYMSGVSIKNIFKK